jgi:glutamate--cysteine ligase catalytic subunit
MYTNGTPGFPDLLAKHFAHLFVRDPLIIFAELIDQDDTKSKNHFDVRQQINCKCLGTNLPSTEHPVSERENTEIQTAST